MIESCRKYSGGPERKGNEKPAPRHCRKLGDEELLGPQWFKPSYSERLEYSNRGWPIQKQLLFAGEETRRAAAQPRLSLVKRADQT